MKKLLFAFLLILGGCASSPEKAAGFECSHVVVREFQVNGVTGYQLVCNRWERKPREKSKPSDSWHYYAA